MIEPKIEILADSINSATTSRCTTFLIYNFPYRLIQEPSTHRLIKFGSNYDQYNTLVDTNPFTDRVSRNSASTRAIPVQKIIDKILEDNYIPTFTRNVSGMQGINDLDLNTIIELEKLYIDSRDKAIENALKMHKLGAHKQEVNGVLSPYLLIPILATATNWDNFFTLRCHESAHPDFKVFAEKMLSEYHKKEKVKYLKCGEWHLPFNGKFDNYPEITLNQRLMVCAARNARLSYNTFDGEHSIEKDESTYKKLLDSPLHGSPFEHNLMRIRENITCGNFHGGWVTQRKLIEDKRLLESLAFSGIK
jgi:hypothetical protein